jgi:propionyl-CoA carboxylase alpha chain/3-methylcrotonyl-CoA carboxylase alpha subunit
VVWPVRANAGFLRRCLLHPRFIAGDVDTGFIAAEEAALTGGATPPEVVAGAFMGQIDLDDYYRERMHEDGKEVWRSSSSALYGMRLNGPPRFERRLAINGAVISADCQPMERDTWWRITVGDRTWTATGTSGVFVNVWPEGADEGQDLHMALDRPVLFHGGEAFEFHPVSHGGAGEGPASDGVLRAPMPGKIVATPAKAGDTVAKGQPVVVLEAMKMEHALVAPFDGIVGEVAVAIGDQVADGAVLATVEAAA